MWIKWILCYSYQEISLRGTQGLNCCCISNGSWQQGLTLNMSHKNYVLVKWSDYLPMSDVTFLRSLNPNHSVTTVIWSQLAFAVRFKVVHLALHITIKLTVWIPCSENFNGSPLPTQWQRFLSQAFKSLCNPPLSQVLWVQAKWSFFLSIMYHLCFNIIWNTFPDCISNKDLL